ncbi:MAG: transposase, partial [Candidatus Aerophobetes bacterium]|nr:transposase [Candidatus Aerophobetes bacterium]
ETGGKIVRVNPKGTSQICSRCGNLVPKSLFVRVHKCPNCGIVLDRDYNSALNILQKAIGKGLAEFTPWSSEAFTPQGERLWRLPIGSR